MAYLHGWTQIGILILLNSFTATRHKQNNYNLMKKHSQKSNTQPTQALPPSHNPITPHLHPHAHQPPHSEQQYEHEYEQGGGQSQIVPQWKQKEQRKKYRKQIFGEHYNYNYRRPNQHKMYRIQENRNTEIQRSNRILLQKIQSIFKRSMGRKRIKQITTSQAVSTSQFTNKTSQMAVQSQPHSVSHIKSSHIANIEQELQSKLSNKNRKNRQSMIEGLSKVGEVNRNIVLAKKELNPHTSTNKEIANRNLVRLEELENSMVNKRKRIQTEMHKPAHKYSGKSIRNAEEIESNGADVQPMGMISIQQQQNKKTSRKTITSNSQHSPNPHPHPQILPTTRSSSKIILHRATLPLNNKPYSIEIYVQGNMYIISARSQRNGQEYHELITMPYRHYHQLYKSRLGQSHENVLGFLFVEPVNGLLQVRGFESRFMDIVNYGEIQVERESTVVEREKVEESRVTIDPAKNVIVHYSKSHAADDPFDRMTVVNSELKGDIRDINSTPGPVEEEPAKGKVKVEDKLTDSKVEQMTSSQMESRVRRKNELSSHLINIQIEPVKPAAEEKKQEPLTNEKLPFNNESSLSDISREFPSKPRQKEIYTMPTKKERVYEPYNQEQYEDEQIILDNH